MLLMACSRVNTAKSYKRGASRGISLMRNDNFPQYAATLQSDIYENIKLAVWKIQSNTIKIYNMRWLSGNFRVPENAAMLISDTNQNFLSIAHPRPAMSTARKLA